MKKRSKEIIDLAIIIPTLNEEHFIGYLLDSIINQNVQPKEIVMVDAYSKDKTIARIKSRQFFLPQLKVFQIARFTIARQRNFGAEQTTAKHLLFLDADMVLKDKKTLGKYMSEVDLKKPEAAAAYNYPLSNFWKDKIFFFAMNSFYTFIKPFWPMANGMNIYMRRDFFKKIGGFDEVIRVGEDHELIQRVVKNVGKFIYLENVKVYTSVRRYSKEGRRNFTFKMVRSFFHIMFHGYQKNPIEYEFGRHQEIENK